MLLMPRGQRDKHARETSSCRFVPVFVSSRKERTTKDVDFSSRKNARCDINNPTASANKESPSSYRGIEAVWEN